ncbi:hypothetical protein Tco_0633960 [Tanacetum coccineum]
MMDQENEATKQSDAVRKEFEAQCNRELFQGMATKASSINIFNTVSTPVNAACASRTSNDAGSSSIPLGRSFPINVNDLLDEPLMPDLEDTAEVQRPISTTWNLQLLSVLFPQLEYALIPIVESFSKKRSKEDSDEYNAKKQKLENDAEKKELRDSMDVVPRDDIAIDIESLATKYPIVDWKTHVLTKYDVLSNHQSRWKF